MDFAPTAELWTTRYMCALGVSRRSTALRRDVELTAERGLAAMTPMRPYGGFGCLVWPVVIRAMMVGNLVCPGPGPGPRRRPRRSDAGPGTDVRNGCCAMGSPTAAGRRGLVSTNRCWLRQQRFDLPGTRARSMRRSTRRGRRWRPGCAPSAESRPCPLKFSCARLRARTPTSGGASYASVVLRQCWVPSWSGWSRAALPTVPVLRR
jgi:hypothetical protein